MDILFALPNPHKSCSVSVRVLYGHLNEENLPMPSQLMAEHSTIELIW
jgi:hypothetical protein